MIRAQEEALEAHIEESRRDNQIVVIRFVNPEMATEALDYIILSAQENVDYSETDEEIDVWGWSEETKVLSDCDWRLLLKKGAQ